MLQLSILYKDTMIPNKQTYYSVSSKWSIQYTEQSKEMMKLHLSYKKKPYLLFFLGVKIVIVSNAFNICVCFLGGEVMLWVDMFYQSWFSTYTAAIIRGHRIDHAYSEEGSWRWKFKRTSIGFGRTGRLRT